MVRQNVRSEIEKKAVEALKEILSRVPFLTIEEISQESVVPALKNYPSHAANMDILARLKLSSSEDQLLIAEVKNSGQPRYASLAINHLLRCRESYKDAYFVFMAPYISPRSAEICRREGMGYVDFSENYYLSFKNVFMEGKNYPSLYEQSHLR